MVTQSAKCVSGLLAVVLLAGGGGCAHWRHAPDQCGCEVSESGLVAALDRFCTGESLKHWGWPIDCDCTSGSTDCKECRPSSVPGSQQLADLRLKCKWRPGCNVQPGPPPVSYRPPMPPEFLPVPTQPIFAAVNLDAPEPMRGAVEVEFGPQLLIPGRD